MPVILNRQVQERSRCSIGRQQLLQNVLIVCGTTFCKYEEAGNSGLPSYPPLEFLNQGTKLSKATNPRLTYICCYGAFLFIRFTIIFIRVSFSSGLLTAIINVNATRALLSIILLPSESYRIPFRSRK